MREYESGEKVRPGAKMHSQSTALPQKQSVSVPARGGTAQQKSLLELQALKGNRYVQRMLSLDHEANDAGSDVDVEGAIRQESGGGQSLNTGLRRRMENSFGADFGEVRIHDNPRSHALSRSLEARAFTTGPDIFFSEGAYHPDSSSGLELLAHELTHVVQQTGSSIRTKLTVSEPQDPEELEADAVAKSVVEADRFGEHD